MRSNTIFISDVYRCVEDLALNQSVRKKKLYWLNSVLSMELYVMSGNSSFNIHTVNSDWTLYGKHGLYSPANSPWIIIGMLFLLGDFAGVIKVNLLLRRLFIQLAYHNILHKLLNNSFTLCKYTYTPVFRLKSKICDILNSTFRGHIESILYNLVIKLQELLGFIPYCLRNTWNITHVTLVLIKTCDRLSLIHYLQWNYHKVRFISHQAHRMLDSWLGFSFLILVFSQKV